MQFIPEIVIICLFFSLYSIFVYAKDNFVLLRKNVTLEQLFNIAFLNFFFCLLCARIVYVLEHISLRFLNPLVFFLFPYFPGLSFAGGIAGYVLFLGYITKKKKLPLWNIFDIFSLSLFLSITIGILLVGLGNFIAAKKISMVFIFAFLANLIFLFILSAVFSKNKLRDGSMGFLTCALITFMQFLLRMFLRTKTQYFHFAAEDLLLALVTIILLIFCIRQESVLESQKSKVRSSLKRDQ